MIEKYDNETKSGINGKKRVDVVQGRNEDDLLQFDYKKCEFTDFSDGLKIGFEPHYVRIINTSRFDKSDDILAIALSMVLAKAYNAKMRELENKANENDSNHKELQACYTEVCNFDLKFYRSMPVLQSERDNRLLVGVWEKISTTYRVSQTHDELKDAIIQMSRVLTDKKNDKQSLWFSVAAVVIALVSLLVAVVSALPVVEKLLK